MYSATAAHRRDLQIGDLVVVPYLSFAKPVYKIRSVGSHIFMTDVETGEDYPEVFTSTEELEDYIIDSNYQIIPSH